VIRRLTRIRLGNRLACRAWGLLRGSGETVSTATTSTPRFQSPATTSPAGRDCAITSRLSSPDLHLIRLSVRLPLTSASRRRHSLGQSALHWIRAGTVRQVRAASLSVSVVMVQILRPPTGQNARVTMVLLQIVSRPWRRPRRWATSSWTAQEAGADLHRRRAEDQAPPQRLAITDATGRDHWNVEPRRPTAGSSANRPTMPVSAFAASNAPR